MCVCVYIYIYIYREREREIGVCVYRCCTKENFYPAVVKVEERKKLFNNSYICRIYFK